MTVNGESTAGSRVRVALVVAAVGLVFLVAGAFLLFRSGPRTELSAGPNVLVNQDANSLNAHNSPSIARNPHATNQVVVADRIDRPQFGAAVHTSSDGGRTWRDTRLFLPAGEDHAFAPDVAYDKSGRLYVLFSTLHGAVNSPAALWLESSTDGGGTFGKPVRVTGPYAYQPRLAVDPSSGHVHITWLQAAPVVETVPNGFGPPPNPVMMATSTNQGQSFSQPVRVSEASRLRVGVAVPAVGPKGQVYVLYEDFGGDAADLEGKAERVYTGDFSLVLASSSDHGATFRSAGVVDSTLKPFERFIPYFAKFPGLAVDPDSGALYAGWATLGQGGMHDHQGGGGHPVVKIKTSTDEGKSWAATADLGGRHQTLAQLSVAPGGRVDAAVTDRRDDPADVMAAAYFVTSLDHGKNWTTISLSDRLYDTRVGPAGIAGADEGSRLGLVSLRDGAYAVWTDTRRGTTDTDKQDIFFAPVTISSR